LSGVTLPDGFLAWALLYFILGYLLYASILGALGALAPSTREGAQFTFIAMLPLMLPLWLSNIIIESPNEPVSVFLSLFPLTSPTSMITRLAAGPVPLIQIIAGLIGLAITAYLFVLLSARFFRADTLLSSSSLSLRRIAQGLRR
jgi:ABC-2 type transport system permease protein